MTIDTILVMGGAGSDRRRPQRALEAWHAHNYKPFIICCGSHTGVLTGKPSRPESTIMQQYLVSRGVPRDSIEEEWTSLDTLANVVLATPLLKRVGAQTVGIVTDDYHMQRSLWTAARVHGTTYQFNPLPVTPDKYPELHRQIPIFRVQEQVITTALKFDLRNIAPGDYEGFNTYLRTKHPFHAKGGLRKMGAYNVLMRAYLQIRGALPPDEAHGERKWQ